MSAQWITTKSNLHTFQTKGAAFAFPGHTVNPKRSDGNNGVAFCGEPTNRFDWAPAPDGLGHCEMCLKYAREAGEFLL